MYRIIFRYRWAALLFVFLIIGTTIRLVGTEEGDGQLAQMQQQVKEQREQFAQTTSDAGEEPFPEEIEEVEAEPEFGFAEDTDLIDAAEGIDPTPDQPDEPGERDEPVELVNRDEEQRDF